MPVQRLNPAPAETQQLGRHGLLDYVRDAASTIQPVTATEIVLLALVRELGARLERLEQHAFELQAENVFLSAQIAAEKLKYKQVMEQKAEQEEGLDSQTLYEEALREWREAEEKRKRDAAFAKEKNKLAMKAFNNKKAIAAKKGKATTSRRPVLIPIPKAIPRPRKRDFFE
ncbi:hypothetical protein D9613_000209 [Agrocybe pediades]|uniref:Uncharacterized protein n=1 Tax=Agrocybe pediades TaxID=84607 RepID=A0A8H4R2M1_9AGAR|nr:hypothetical protein D9613_000209 [Agrocybe pediades]